MIFFKYGKGLALHPFVTFRGLYSRIKIRALRKFKKKTAVLIERPSGIGDIICTFPAILAFRESNPNALIVYGVSRNFFSIVQMAHVADVIVESNWSNLLPNPCMQDYAEHHRLLLEDMDPKAPLDQHLVDRFSEILNVIPKSRQPRLHIPRDCSYFAISKLRSYRARFHLLVGIHIGPSWHVREWPAHYWAELVLMFYKQFNCVVFQLGSDVETTKGFVSTPRIPNAIDFTGGFNLSQTSAIIEALDLFIGIDSGLLHISGAVSTPCVGLFGAVDPRLRLPPESLAAGVTSDVPCLGCQHRRPIIHWKDDCPHSIACMKTLTPKMVFDSVTQIINKTTIYQ
jgi:ADP-heptose:LPS heptosyltransferase